MSFYSYIRNIILFGAAVILIGCGTSINQNFFRLGLEQELPLKKLDNYWLSNYHLSDDAEAKFRIPGAGNLLIAEYSQTDYEYADTTEKIFKIYPDLVYRIYTDLPIELSPDSLDIAGKSICHLVGRFDLRDYLKIYRCGEGYLVIDTVKGSRIKVRLSGTYYNTAGDSLVFRGSISAKRK